MNNLTFCLKNGIKLAANKRGEVFITMAGYITLSGKPKQTICERATRALLVGKIFETTDLKVPGQGNRPCKLISHDLACKWLEKDNPELAKAVDGDLMGWLSQPQDLSQFHKAKAVDFVPIAQLETATQNLERRDCGGIELVIDRLSGEAWATVRGYARMSDKPQSTAQSRLDRMSDGERNALTKMAVIGIPEGVQGERTTLQNVRLVSAKLCFKWAIKDNPELAEAMGSAGATVYMHQLAGFKITSDAIAKPQPEPTPPSQPQQLSPADRIKLASEADKLFEKYGMDTNPRYSQATKDFIGDILGMNQNALPAPDAPKWYGVAERAEQLGYPVALVVRHRSPLGCWVAKRVNGSRKESRLCNGTERPINLYPVTPQLDEAIASYFATHQFF